MTQTIAPPFAPRGKPAIWKDDDWKLLLLIGDDDYDSAENAFERHVPQSYRGIITGDGWTFDPDTQQYVRRNGKPLNDADLKSIMLLFVLAEENELEELAESAARGDLEIDEWQDQSAVIIKDVYVASAIVGAGGVDRLTPEDIAEVSGRPDPDIAKEVGYESVAPAQGSVPRKPGEYEDVEPAQGGNLPPGGLADAFTRLDRFAKQVESGDVKSSAAMIRRAGQYAPPANGIYESARNSSQGRRVDENGTAVAVEERNILDDDAAHCHSTPISEGCPEITDAGWADFGTYPLPGLRTCGPKCRCRMEYRTKPPETSQPQDPQ